MKKVDYKKELKQLYKASAKNIELIEVPVMNFLMIDGKGDPNTSLAFKEAVETLYALSYTLKFMIKKGALAIDYGVMPLEGLWWADDMTKFDANKKEDWKWTIMIMQPEMITQEMVETALEQVKAKKQLQMLDQVRFEPFEEGKAVQILHIGPFSEEGLTIEKLHEYIDKNKGTRTGKHHEIYLSDMRRTAPEKLKTIIRQSFI